MLRAVVISTLLALPSFGWAQDVSSETITEITARPAQNQDICITQMTQFPTDDPVARYQFFQLTLESAQGATPDFRAMLDHFGQPAVEPDTPVLSVIEDIANPVLRQAAPEVIIASMNYLIDFAQNCETFINGQTASLLAFDASLGETEFNQLISEDALFLRQILSESLSRVNVESDPEFGYVSQNYAISLVTMRDVIEFTAFETEIAELESLYMEDLDGRLARSNDIINQEMDREILGDSVSLAKDMNEAARQKAKQERLYRLIRIFGGGY